MNTNEKVRDLEARLTTMTEFTTRNTKIKLYQQIYTLADPLKGDVETFEHGVTNYPMAACDLAIYLISDGQMRLRLATSIENKIDKNKASQSERALYGILRQIDEEYRNSGDGVTRRRVNATDLIVKGSVFNLSCVIPSELGVKSTPIFVAERWEPETCYPLYGRRGLRAFVHKYETSVEQYEELERELGLTPLELVGKKSVTVSDVWWLESKDKNDSVYRAMIADGEMVLEPDYAGGGEDVFSSIPIRGGSVFRDHSSFIEGIKGSVSDLNRIYSYLLQAARSQVKGFVIVQSDRNLIILEADEFLNSDITIKQILPGEEIKSVKFIEGFPEMQSLLNIPMGDMQRKAFPFSSWGGVTEGQSGYLYSLSLMNAMSNAGPFHTFLNMMDGDVCRDFLLMYKRGNYKPIKVGGNINNRYYGFFHEDFDRKNIPDFLFVEVTKPMALPQNLIQKLTAMSMALPGQQLLPRETALDVIWEDDDPELTDKLIVEEQVDKMLIPLKVPGYLRESAAAAEAKGDPESARFARQARALATTLERQLEQQGQGQPLQQGQARQRLARPELGGMQGQSPTQPELGGMMGEQPPINNQEIARKRLANMGVDMGTKGLRS